MHSPKRIVSIIDTLIYAWLQKLFTYIKDESDAISDPFVCKKMLNKESFFFTLKLTIFHLGGSWPRVCDD